MAGIGLNPSKCCCGPSGGCPDWCHPCANGWKEAIRKATFGGQVIQGLRCVYIDDTRIVSGGSGYVRPIITISGQACNNDGIYSRTTTTFTPSVVDGEIVSVQTNSPLNAYGYLPKCWTPTAATSGYSGPSLVVSDPGYGLLVRSWGDGSTMPTSGTWMVVIGIDTGGKLHIRIFDGSGNRVTDVDETMLPTSKASAIDSLKKAIPSILYPYAITVDELNRYGGAARELVDQPPFMQGLGALIEPVLGLRAMDSHGAVGVPTVTDTSATFNDVTVQLISAPNAKGWCATPCQIPRGDVKFTYSVDGSMNNDAPWNWPHEGSFSADSRTINVVGQTGAQTSPQGVAIGWSGTQRFDNQLLWQNSSGERGFGPVFYSGTIAAGAAVYNRAPEYGGRITAEFSVAMGWATLGIGGGIFVEDPYNPQPPVVLGVVHSGDPDVDVSITCNPFTVELSYVNCIQPPGAPQQCLRYTMSVSIEADNGGQGRCVPVRVFGCNGLPLQTPPVVYALWSDDPNQMALVDLTQTGIDGSGVLNLEVGQTYTMWVVSGANGFALFKQPFTIDSNSDVVIQLTPGTDQQGNSFPCLPGCANVFLTSRAMTFTYNAAGGSTTRIAQMNLIWDSNSRTWGGTKNYDFPGSDVYTLKIVDVPNYTLTLVPDANTAADLPYGHGEKCMVIVAKLATKPDGWGDGEYWWFRIIDELGYMGFDAGQEALGSSSVLNNLKSVLEPYWSGGSVPDSVQQTAVGYVVGFTHFNYTTNLQSYWSGYLKQYLVARIVGKYYLIVTDQYYPSIPIANVQGSNLDQNKFNAFKDAMSPIWGTTPDNATAQTLIQQMADMLNIIQPQCGAATIPITYSVATDGTTTISYPAAQSGCPDPSGRQVSFTVPLSLTCGTWSARIPMPLPDSTDPWRMLSSKSSGAISVG